MGAMTAWTCTNTLQCLSAYSNSWNEYLGQQAMKTHKVKCRLELYTNKTKSKYEAEAN
jgi:hypothetical protein